MRVVANENIDGPSVAMLRLRRHDVVRVTESWRGLDDASIMARARAAERIIITLDRDYGDVVFRDRLPAPAGIVFIRFEPEGLGQIGARVQELIDDGWNLIAMHTVVGRDRVRQRPLPGRLQVRGMTDD